MEEGIVVVSCFDGMGCLYIALKELGIKVKRYFAYEVDKYAIKQTQYNFPDITHLGDIKKASIKDFEGYKVDLFCGGSPCQGFSFAGKQLNFDDPRSALFFEYVRLWKEIKAINQNAVFLLENVNMKKEYLRVISEYLGVFPVRINSNLVSAQNRDRWYWSNIRTKDVGLFSELWTDIPQPEDKKIMLKDILQTNVPDKYFLSDPKMIDFVTDEWRLNKKYTQINGEKGLPQMARQYATWCGDFICVAMRGRNPENPSDRRTGSPTEQRLEPKTDGKTNCLTSVAKDNLLTDGYKLRRLTPIECARLQTIPEWYEFKFVINRYFGYICSETNTTKLWQQNAKLVNAIGIFQINQLDYATCTTLDLLELEQLNLIKLIGQKNAKLSDVIEMQKQKNMETYVYCITNDMKDMDHLNYQLNRKKRLVNIVIEKLEKTEVLECATRIIEVTNYMAIHLKLKEGKNHQEVEDICLVEKERMNTKSSWRIKLVENSNEEKLSIILTLINWIIDRKIYTYAKELLNIRFYIENLKNVEQNYLSVDISDLKMESILSTSDTQIYRMLGNGWTVEVIKHIFSFLNGFEKTNVRGQKINYGQISTNVNSKSKCSTCG